jgi:Tfp pilus assembly protein PilV
MHVMNFFMKKIQAETKALAGNADIDVSARMSPIRTRAGTGMVEVIMAAAIMGIVLITVINVYHSLATMSLQNTSKIQTTFLLEEGVEALRVMRDSGWNTYIAPLTVGRTYYLKFQGGLWVATTTTQVIDDYTRSFVLADVNRDGSFNITTSGGSADANSRKATVTITWDDKNGTTTKTVDTYLFNTFGN